MKISLYKNIKSTTPKYTSKCVYKILESIKDGTYKNTIGRIRVEPDKTERNKIKATLENVTFSGTFSTRGNSNLKQHSGLACLDFDDVVNLDQLTELINKDKFTFSSFVSPSGNGLKVLVKMPLIDNNEDYQDYYLNIVKHYIKYHELDQGTKDLARATYLSFDNNLFLNIESETFTDKINRPIEVIKKEPINIPLTDSNEIADRLDVWFKKRWNNVNRNNNLHAYARQMNSFGVAKNVCEDYILRYGDEGVRNEILALINSAYKHTSDFGIQTFEDSNKVRHIKNLVLSGERLDSIKSKIKDVDLLGLEVEIKKHNDELKNDEFWYYTEKNQIKLASFRFLNYLESNNLFKFYPDKDSGTYLFVKNDNNFLSVFDDNKIKDFTLNDLRTRGIIDAFELMADNSQAFNPRYLSMIKTIDITFNQDTADASYIYYKNCAIKTTKDKIHVLKYNEIKDLIWKNQVIDREVVLKNESDGVFKTFIWRISGENVERYYTLKSVIGYLMHSYQNDAKPKAIIFNDEMISDDIPNGGSGKGLIHKAMGHIKNIVVEDGKKFDARAQFAYQKVNKDTQIFLMDDVPKHFNFENLFSIVTEGMTIEKKGKDAYQIPFKESPKISITTNYTVKGSGASFYRRVFEVEIANHFNDNYTPEDEFKHQFFSEWDESEWQSFDNFMIRCIQFYLKNGLVESNKVNLEFRKFKNDLGYEFIEFMESKTFDDTPLDRKKFRDEFNIGYPNISRYNTAQKFNTKVREYCNYYKFNFEERSYNGSISFYINDNKTQEDDGIAF
jgi:hypothetical protein